MTYATLPATRTYTGFCSSDFLKWYLQTVDRLLSPRHLWGHCGRAGSPPEWSVSDSCRPALTADQQKRRCCCTRLSPDYRKHGEVGRSCNSLKVWHEENRAPKERFGPQINEFNWNTRCLSDVIWLFLKVERGLSNNQLEPTLRPGYDLCNYMESAITIIWFSWFKRKFTSYESSL